MADPQLGLSAYPDEPSPADAALQPPIAGSELSAYPAPAPDPLRETLKRAASMSPDTAAKSYDLARRTGLPTATVDRNFDAVTAQVKGNSLDPFRFRQETPHLAQWLEANTHHAAIAQDDLSHLSAMERAFQVARNLVEFPIAGVYKGITAGLWEPIASGADVAARTSEALTGVPGGWFADLASFAGRQAKDAAAVAEAIHAPTEHMGPFERAAYAGLSGVGEMTPALIASGATGTPGPMLTLFGTQGASEAYQQARTEGLDTPDALRYAGMQGAWNVITAMPSMHWLIGDLKAGAPIFKEVLHQLATIVPFQSLNTLAQNVDAYEQLPSGRASGKTPLDFLMEQPAALRDTLISSLVMVGAQTSIVHGTARVFHSLGDAAQQSKALKRSPDAVRDVLDRMTQDMPPASIPTDAWTTYWQGVGEDPAAKADELTGRPGALDLAVREGHDLAIPMSRYVTEIAANKPHSDFFAAEAKLDPSVPNPRQQAIDAAFHVEQSKAAEEAAKNAPPAPPTARERIHDQMVGQLVGAGLTRSRAAHVADLAEAGFGTMAESAGLDPAEVYAGYGVGGTGLHVQKTTEAAHAAAGAAPETVLPADITSLRDRLAEPDGGFTVDLMTGAEPQTGFSVALPGHEHVLPERAMTVEDLARYVAAHQDALTQPGAHLGGWHDPETGQVMLDTSIVAPTRQAAIDLGLDYNQKAVYDYVNRRSIDLATDSEARTRAGNRSVGGQPGATRGASDRPEADTRGTRGGAESAGRGDASGAVRTFLQATTEGLRPGHIRPPAVEDAGSVARAYARSLGLPDPRYVYAVVDEPTARRIADAYDALPVDDSANLEVAASYAALVRETRAQWDHAIAEGMTFEPWSAEGQPYATSIEMARDVAENHHLFFYQGGEPHPFMSTPDDTGFTSNEQFRAIHDLYAHAAGGFGFGPRGEESAWRAHMEMFSPEAARAMTTETRGQNSWVNFGSQNYDAEGHPRNIPAPERPYATQKVGLLPAEFTTAPERPAVQQAIAHTVNGSLRGETLYQSVYHGTPHDVDRFTTDRVGSGEGAQAYGWGLYFAQNRAVAQDYQERLSRASTNVRISVGGETLPDGPERHGASLIAFNDLREIRSASQRWVKELAAGGPSAAGLRDTARLAGVDPVDYWTRLRNFVSTHTTRDITVERGNLYTADIADEHVNRMIDWDAAIGKQPEAVQAAVREALRARGYLRAGEEGPRQLARAFDSYLMERGSTGDGATGGAAYELLVKDEAERAASDAIAARKAIDARYDDQARPMDFPLTDGRLGAADFKEWVRLTGEIARAKEAAPETVSKRLAASGVPGITYLDAGSRGSRRGNSRNLVVFDDSIVTLTHRNGEPVTPDDRRTFFQDHPRTPTHRGATDVTPDGRITIGLFEHANPSTILHELGHTFLEVFGDLADHVRSLDPSTLTPSQTRLLGDYDALLAHFGVTDRRGVGREHHESFARQFEAYLRDGTAPSAELRSAFGRFAAWLRGVYRSLRDLGVNVHPDVRGIFDRMLASEDAIRAAEAESRQQPLFLTPEAAGMTPAVFDRYRSAIQAAHDEAQRTVDSQVQRELAREETDAWKTQRSAIHDEVMTELRQQPVYRAAEALKGDLSSVPPDVAAELLGFPSGDAMTRAVAEAVPLELAAKRETDRRMHEVHASILTDASLPERARQAVSGPQRDVVIRAELAALHRLQATAAPHMRAAERQAGREQAYQARWMEAEARLRIAIAEGHKQVEIDRLTREAQSLKAQARGGAATVRAGIPSAAAVQAHAERRIADLAVRDIRPRMFWSAARAASKNATERAARQDFDGAIAAKTQELVNNAYYSEAVKAKTAIDDAVQDFRKFGRSDATLAKSRDLDFVNAGRAVLASIGLGRSDRAATDYLHSLNEYDPEAHAEVRAMIEAAIPGVGLDYKDLSVSQFTAVTDAVNALWELSRESETITLAGERRQLDAVRTEVLDQVRLHNPEQPNPGLTRTISAWDRAKVGLQGFRARMRRIESWVTAIDNGREGPTRRAIFDPVNEGAVAYEVARRQVATHYAEHVVTRLDTTERHRDIAAPELGYTFKNKHQYLLGALLHIGNGFEPGSNGYKLLVGYGWGEVRPDGTLDTSRWQRFEERMQREGVLTKADYDFVQAVWDLNEAQKPAAQRAYKQRFGRYFDEVTAAPFTTPFGEYRGGYYPAIADPFIVSAASDRAEAKALLEGGVSGAFPTVGSGFGKTRVMAYAKPLQLDASLVLSHLNTVLRFIHLGQPVHEVARLVMHPSFRESMDRVDPGAVSDLIKPYLDRAASQRMFVPMQGKAGRAADAVARAIRARGSMQILALNATVTAEQLTHFPSVVAHPDVEVGRLMAGLWSLTRNSRQLYRDVAESSPFMATRESAGMDEARAAIDRILLDPNPAQRAGAWVNDHVTVLVRGIQSAMDHATWQAVYDKVAEEPEATHEQAVRRADSAVREALGSYRPQDRSAVEGGNQMLGLLNLFYGFFNTKLNMLGTEAVLASRMSLNRRFSRAFAVYSFGFMVPAISGKAIKTAIGSQPWKSDDEDDATALLKFWWDSQLEMGARMVPFGGAAVKAITMSFGKGQQGELLNAPAVTMVEHALHAPGEAYRAMTDEDATDAQRAKARTDIFTMLGLMTGLPLRPVGQATNVVEDFATQR